jgi:serine/threonine protein kinase/Tol biopolymer transport system component
VIGSTISHYKVLEKLGEGGMGVVYKAEDTKLDRTVALKFLPPHLAASEQDKARFVQEAKAAAALNHPNVCSIIDIQEHDGQMFIVMEFVDGQTLREKRGTISFKQATDIGIQIADGLAAAHEKGIVHRDIKPENIMIRKDGIAQIMDFGLAKLRSASSKINRLTKEGSTVGTAGYMSPEQIQGQDVDHRSDIFSFGVVLYEMFTGQLPFKGVHETALAYEIVNVDATPMAAIKPDIDPALDGIVLDCLEKDVKERCQSVAEVARDLRRVKRESTRQRASRVTASRPAFVQSASMPAMPQPSEGLELSKGSSRLPWIVSGILFLIAAGAIAFHFLTLQKSPEKEVIRSQILSPVSNIYDVTWGGHIAISPDGKTIAFAAADSLGVNHIWVRPVSSMTATMLAGTDEGKFPFWSPDNRKIAFFAKGKLRNIDATGGPILTICDAGDGRGGAWNQSGMIIFSPGPTETLSKVAAAGGIPTQLTKFDTMHHESSHRWPAFLPDGNHFMYSTLTALGTSTDNDVVRISALDSSISKVLFNASTNVCFASGHLLYIRQGTLMAQPFDLTKLDFAGEAVPIAEQIIFAPPYARGSFSVAQNGMLILQSGENQIQRAAIFDVTGNRTRLLSDLNPAAVRFSPDGKRMAFSVMDQLSRNGDVWINELLRGTSSRVTFHPSVDISPVWSPRGDSVVFQSNRSGIYDLYIKSANGTGDDILLVQSNRNKAVSDWSLDGKYITYSSGGDPKTKTDLWILPMVGDRKPIPFLQTEFNEGNGTFSPDSRWIVYSSDETGKQEIYARLVDGSGGKFKISTSGGRRPFWRMDSRKIYFSSMDRKLQIAYVNAGSSTIVVDSIKTLWDYESRNMTGNSITDVSSDGKFFAAVVTDSKLTTAPITLIVNWDEELKKK